ncbi:MAG: 3-dehydroquinate synthase [Rhodospirillales bacterium]|nr:3-dehydroquinate synthase [Rhodospirillales bacterium]
MTQVRKIEVGLGERSYDIVAGPGLMERAGDYLLPVLRRRHVAVVTDENVAARHLARLAAGLDAVDIAFTPIVLPPGEATKSFRHLEDLLNRLLSAGLDRGGCIVALGGGVVGDLAGFAAAILLRGIDYVQIPTTLLAQVDSAVGGKTAIDAPQGKNLVGAFHQPRLVLADTTSLSTLPDRELRAGYAEVVKYGLIDRPDFFGWLEANGGRVLAREDDALAHAIAVSCEAKADVVAADEREAGRRALLNLGHTFGHAFEAEAGFCDALLHGEAVSLGMVMAFRMSVRLGLCPEEDLDRMRAHLAGADLPVDPPGANASPGRRDALIERMRRDKKAEAGRIVLVLARGIGRAFVHRDVGEEALAALLDEALAA